MELAIPSPRPPARNSSRPDQFVAGALLLLAMIPSPGAAAGASLAPTRDNTLFLDPSGQISDGQGPAFFTGNNSQGSPRRGLVRFDVASVIPPGSIVVYVQLKLTVSNAPNDTARAIGLYRALSDWGEGSSWASGGTGDTAQVGDATWLHTFYPDRFWATPGGDSQASPSASIAVGGVGTYFWSGAGMVADVQRWLDDPGHNFGWLVRGDENHLATARRFESRESADAAARPVLTIETQSPVDVPVPVASPVLVLGPGVPNPTRASARFDFEIPVAGSTRLVLEDASGRLVATLLNRLLPAGRHAVTWNGRSASGGIARPGVYFCRLTLAEHRAPTQKLVVSR